MLGPFRPGHGVKAAVDIGAAADELGIDVFCTDDLDPAEIGKRTGREVEGDVEPAGVVVSDGVARQCLGQRIAVVEPRFEQRRFRLQHGPRTGESPGLETQFLEIDPVRHRHDIDRPEDERLAGNDPDLDRHRRHANRVERADRGERPPVDGDKNFPGIKSVLVEYGGQRTEVLARPREQAGDAGGRRVFPRNQA